VYTPLDSIEMTQYDLMILLVHQYGASTSSLNDHDDDDGDDAPSPTNHGDDDEGDGIMKD
jgi:hypothetical protein